MIAIGWTGTSARKAASKVLGLKGKVPVPGEVVPSGKTKIEFPLCNASLMVLAASNLLLFFFPFDKYRPAQICSVSNKWPFQYFSLGYNTSVNMHNELTIGSIYVM